MRRLEELLVHLIHKLERRQQISLLESFFLEDLRCMPPLALQIDVEVTASSKNCAKYTIKDGVSRSAAIIC